MKRNTVIMLVSLTCISLWTVPVHAFVEPNTYKDNEVKLDENIVHDEKGAAEPKKALPEEQKNLKFHMEKKDAYGMLQQEMFQDSQLANNSITAKAKQAGIFQAEENTFAAHTEERKDAGFWNFRIILMIVGVLVGAALFAVLIPKMSKMEE